MFQREDQRERDKSGYRVKLTLCPECFPKLGTEIKVNP